MADPNKKLSVKSYFAMIITLATICSGIFFIEDRYAKAEETNKSISMLKAETTQTFTQIRKDLRKDALQARKQILLNRKYLLRSYKRKYPNDPEIDRDIKEVKEEISIVNELLDRESL